jgi:hypothetical protein
VYRPARISDVLERSSMHSLGTTGLKAEPSPTERIPPSSVSTIPICSSNTCPCRTSPAACWLTGCRSTSSGLPRAPVAPANDEEQAQKEALHTCGTLRRIKRFARALLEGVPPHDRDRPANVATAADWIRQCRRAGLYN